MISPVKHISLHSAFHRLECFGLKWDLQVRWYKFLFLASKTTSGFRILLAGKKKKKVHHLANAFLHLRMTDMHRFENDCNYIKSGWNPNRCHSASCTWRCAWQTQPLDAWQWKRSAWWARRIKYQEWCNIWHARWIMRLSEPNMLLQQIPHKSLLCFCCY